MSVYELAILGSATAEDRRLLTGTLGTLLAEFDLVIGDDVAVRDGRSVGDRNDAVAFAAAYFGGDNADDDGPAADLVRASVPVIPTVAADGDFGREIPPFLQPANGLRRRADDPGMRELATALLECVGLLRRQRRVFVSYRRIESRSAAVQLHDLLSSRGFEVFLDTHDIRPGEPFQEVLWHRLVDSDVMVMLDTPGYFDSKWTRQELGRARATDIQVLRVVWPAHVPNKLTDMAETIYLDGNELEGPEGPIVDEVADGIVLEVERLRSRSIAARYMAITGKLRADAEKIGAIVGGIGAHRAIALDLPDGKKVWAYPVVGVPTAEILNDIAEKSRRADQREIPVLVYDHVGIREAWGAHLKWLDENIRAVRAIKVSEAGWTLAAWEA
ncbi:toll/interleukin-1 receptor domain-containing protein [Aureimonas pseudogalii]|uniref:TIR domain-containing protein n=1 Tax=Aureimonas pseudogalii TaxID=1744844 RepID=A0A7W6H5S5_9HYPH|nr:toll/interleukin-1 receptor domain-containing protein [Aureimonas pseudogalii]MBB3999083.1 hypothetical protein [Aureimonas pseudogalii]